MSRRALPEASRMLLLEKIRDTGSITRAAAAAGMSYKTAWDAVNAMNNLYEKPLVASAAGGNGGGGTRLTALGEDILIVFREMEARERILLEGIEAGRCRKDIIPLLRRFWMKTSARNQLLGKVVSVTRGAVNAEVVLKLKGEDCITAIITNESVEELGLKKGRKAYAIIKASWVMVSTEKSSMKLSAKNKLCGTVTKVGEGAVNSEVVIALDGGNTITSIITRESVKELGLKEGRKACAVIKASSVIIGIAE